MENVTSIVEVKANEGVESDCPCPDRLVGVTPVWKALYQQLCDNHVLQGAVLRSEEYWSNRIPKEVQRMCGRQSREKHNSPVPLQADTPFPDGCGFKWMATGDSSKSAVILSSQIDGTEEKLPILNIRELIVSPSLLEDVPKLKVVLSSFIDASVKPDWKQFTFKCPGALWRHFIAPSLWSVDSPLGSYAITASSLSHSDGIMYKFLQNDAGELDAINGREMLEPLRSTDHVFMSLDGF